jgi:chemotaxis protein CheD
VNSLVVGISDCKISDDPEGVLLTYALGSCIGVAAHDPLRGVAGLLHYMLPDSTLDEAKARETPCMFADTGIPLLIDRLCAQGAERRRLVVRIAGGAQILSGTEAFQIGRRNYLAARKLLWKAGILVAAEAVGGDVSRTVRLEVKTGRTFVREGTIDRAMAGRRAAGEGS